MKTELKKGDLVTVVRLWDLGLEQASRIPTIYYRTLKVVSCGDKAGRFLDPISGESTKEPVYPGSYARTDVELNDLIEKVKTVVQNRLRKNLTISENWLRDYAEKAAPEIVTQHERAVSHEKDLIERGIRVAEYNDLVKEFQEKI